MAKAGLSLSNPMMDKLHVGEKPNPYAPYSPIGLGNLSQPEVDQSFQPTFAVPEIEQPRYIYDPDIGINQGTGELYVQGQRFTSDDAARALETEGLLQQPGTGELPVGFTPVGLDAYQQYIASIRDPSTPRLAARNFGRGVDITQMLAGRGLQFIGAEELGGKIVEQQMEDLRKTSPYERMFTDIGSQPNRKVWDWFIANLAQQGPNLIESVLTAALGAGVGAIAGGGPNPFTAAGGALLALSGKQSFKQGVLAAAKKYTEGKTLTAAETKLLNEAASLTAAGQIKAATTDISKSRALSTMVLDEAGRNLATQQAQRAALRETTARSASAIGEAGRTQAYIGGAGLATLGQNYATGVADVYGETIESGDSDRAIAAALGIPYAALEIVPEFLLAGRVLGNLGGRSRLFGTTPLEDISTRTGKAAELAKRAGVGFTVGGTLEGTTEAGQEGLLLAANREVDWDSPEGLNRLVNSFAAGFGVGGPIGAGGGLFGTNAYQSNEPTNLLNPGENPEPNSATTIIIPPYSPTPMLPPPAPLEGILMPREGPPLLGGPSAGATFGALQGPPGVDLTRPYTILTGEGQLPTGPGTQGVLPLFETMPAAEMAARMAPPVDQAVTGQFAPTPVVPNPAQGALQFAPPAPERAVGTMAEQFRGIDRLRMVGQAQAQRQAEIDAQREADFVQMEAQRQLQLAQPQTEMPTVPIPTRQPQQLQLPFRRDEVRRPTRAERLRRGAPPLPVAEATQPARRPTPGEFQRAGQLPLLTQAGEPSVAALRGAALRRPLPAPVEEAGAVATVPPATAEQVRKNVQKLRKQVKEAQKAAAKVEETVVKAAPAAKPAAEKLKKGAKRAVQKRGAEEIPARKPAEAGRKVGEGVPSERKPAAKAETLRKGKAKKEAAKPPVQAEVAEVPPRPKPEAAVAPAAAQEIEGYANPSEAWDDMAPDRATSYVGLHPDVRDKWDNAVSKNKASMALAAELNEENKDLIGQSDIDALRDDIADTEEATSIQDFKDSVYNVVYSAYFLNEETNTKQQVTLARNFLFDMSKFSEEQIGAIKEVFVELANEKQRITAVKAGRERPWYTFAKNNGLLPLVTQEMSGIPFEEVKQLIASGDLKLKNLPEDTKKKLRAEDPKLTKEPNTTSLDSLDQALLKIKLSNLINGLYAGNVVYAKESDLVNEAKKQYKELPEKDRDYIVRGNRLRDYFTEDGEPKINKVDGYFFLTTKLVSVEERARLEKVIREEKRKEEALRQEEIAAERTRRLGDETNPDPNEITDAWDDSEGLFYRDDGTPITSSIPIGRVKLLVKNFLRKLRSKPNVYIFRNVQDLKTRDPALYKRAAAARQQGDFDTTNAVGYSFGPDVIIFSDFVRTEQQLKFVLAHETIGHFGMRGVVPISELKKLFDRLYESDPDIRAAADVMMESRGLPKLEAIEEVLADRAADYDASVLTRVWSMFKNFLNKLGFTFKDDEARYLIGQARKYVRRGNTGNFVSASSIMADMREMDRTVLEGRYSTAPSGSLGQRAYGMRSNVANLGFGATSGFLGAVRSMADIMSRRGDVRGIISAALEQLQTLDNKARRSDGLSRVYKMIASQQQYARRLLSKYHRMSQFTHKPNVSWAGIKGVSEEDKKIAGELLSRAALYKNKQTTDAFIKNFDSLVKFDAADQPYIDAEVLAKIKKAGYVSAKEFRDGFEIEYANGDKVKYQYDVDEKSPIWKVYNEMRDTVNESAIDLLLANFESMQIETKRIISGLNENRATKNVFTNDDLAAIAEVARLYQNARYKGSDVANAGVEIKKNAKVESEKLVRSFGRALFNEDIYRVWMKDPTIDGELLKDHKEFQAAEYDDIRKSLASLRQKITGKEDSFRVQKAIRDMFLFDLMSKNADYYAKRTILGSYVPFTRRGDHQVRLVAYDRNGNIINLDEAIRSTLPYFQFNSETEAKKTAEELTEAFKDLGMPLKDMNDNDVDVTLRAEVSKVRRTPDLSESVNYNEFVYVLNRLNVNILPEAREQIVTILTGQNSRARRSLQRSGTEGWDKDVIRSISEYLETQAHVSAKKLYRHRLDDILLNNRYWVGDDDKLRRMERAVENARTEGERQRAKNAYDEYAYMYLYMKGSAGENTVTINGKEVPTKGRGEDYREYAKSLLRWYSESTNVSDNTEDLLSGEIGSPLKMWVVVAQLGGSVAAAVVNLASLVTHTIPYLSGYNAQRGGYGGGFGGSKSTRAIYKALRDAGSPSLADDAYIADVIAGKKPKPKGLTDDELQFLFEQSEEGLLQAAQFNALVGTARGKVFSNKTQAGIKAWMSMFSYTEQLNRRATALAAYRLEKERSISQGLTEEQAILSATEAARKAVTYSQGEYGMFNRPEIGRGNILQYVYMYKQFVVISVQLLRNLPTRERLLALGFLLLVSGIKGIPFAEDMMDILDTILQKFELKTASVEKELNDFINDIAPGWSQTVMRGVLDQALGGTVSTRLGMGNLGPLTGAFRAGADPAREIADFAGPVWGGISGTFGTLAGLAKYGAETIGLQDDTTSFSSIMRNAPVAALRGITDGMIFLSDGTISNTRGQVVSKDVGPMTIITRMLGFYPAEATAQNDIIRMSKYVSDYAKEIKAGYVAAYVSAKLDNDTARMREIVSDVKEWNRDAEGTGMEITSFVESANRSAREAARPAVARYLKAAPKNIRPETAQLAEMYGIELD